MIQLNEVTYKSLFEKMFNGFALHEIVTDESGKPVNYRFIEINKAFEDMVGLKRDAVIGKLVTEVLPGTDKDPADWIGRYGKVALEGTEERFEDFSEELNKWFSVYAYSPEKGYFATIFADITERKNELKTINDKITEIEKMNKFLVERELKMVELKKEIGKYSKDSTGTDKQTP